VQKLRDRSGRPRVAPTDECDRGGCERPGCDECDCPHRIHPSCDPHQV